MKRNIKKMTAPFLGAMVMVGGLSFGYAGIASAQDVTPTTISRTMPMTKTRTKHFNSMRSDIKGTVSAVNGSALTVVSKNPKSGTVTTYTVDVSKATLKKFTTGSALATVTVSDIAVGDVVFVRGSVTGTSVVAASVMDGLVKPMITKKEGNEGIRTPLGQVGKVTAINGTTITMQEGPANNLVTYTVDASSATVMKDGVASTVSAIAVGDKIMVKGTVTGTNVVATSIADGHAKGKFKK
jgi:Domain of unknown function (DUF5666)